MMARMGNHSATDNRPAARRDHLWVLVIIAGFALFDVWEAWSEVGNKSGFAHGTGWTLTVIVEAFAGYCLFAWFDAPGARSRRMAMWAAITALTLSMIGQGASVLAANAMPPLWLMVFVRILPVIVLALIAVLVHLRRLDREEAEKEQAATERAEADERAALRAEVSSLRGAVGAAQDDAAAARAEAETAIARAEALARKLQPATGSRKAGSRTRKPAGNTARKPAPVTPESAGGNSAEDVDTEARVWGFLQAGYSASEAGRLAGVTDARGRQIARKLAQTAPQDVVGGTSP